MLYYLFEYLKNHYHIPGAGVFQYISFRAAMAVITSLVISLLFGKKIINLLHRKQVGETIRDLGLAGEEKKKGTPTMGGLIILSAIIIPTLLFAKLENIYVILMLIATVWMGLIGFLDDYIKVFKKNKKGLAGKFKVIGQVGLGLIIGAAFYFHPDVQTKVEIPVSLIGRVASEKVTEIVDTEGKTHYMLDRKLPNTTIPFVKENEFNYSSVLGLFGKQWRNYTWIIYILAVVIIVTACLLYTSDAADE